MKQKTITGLEKRGESCNNGLRVNDVHLIMHGRVIFLIHKMNFKRKFVSKSIETSYKTQET